MKLKHVQFLLLLLLSYSEELSRLGNNDVRHNAKRSIRKRQNYEIVDENEPLAQIDVSSFIRSSDENSMSEPYANLLDTNSQIINDFSADNNVMGEYELDKAETDYQDVKSDLPSPKKYIDRKLFPRYVDVNTLTDSNKGDLRLQNNNFDKMKTDWSLHDMGYNSHNEKKCALKRMRFPFFSHKKTTKSKKNKKRKFSFRNTKKQSPSAAKVEESHLNSNSMKMSTEAPKHFKIKKRSYFDRLCPNCKQKVLNANLVDDKLRSTMNNVIHNSRQYFQKTKYPKVVGNINRYGITEVNLENYENIMGN